MNRLAVAVDDHLRYILERCIYSVYDRLNLSWTSNTPLQHYTTLSTNDPGSQVQVTKCSFDKRHSVGKVFSPSDCYNNDRMFLHSARNRSSGDYACTPWELQCFTIPMLHPAATADEITAPRMNIRLFEDIQAILRAEDAVALSIAQQHRLDRIVDPILVYQHLLRQKVDQALLERDTSFNGCRSKVSKVSSSCRVCAAFMMSS